MFGLLYWRVAAQPEVYVLCLCNKTFIPGELLFMSSSRKNDTTIWSWGTGSEDGHVVLAPPTKRWGWAVFFVSQKAQNFSVCNPRHVLGAWLPGQAGEKASFWAPLRDTFFLYLQIWPLPASHVDPGAATWHVSTRGHVGFSPPAHKKVRNGFQSSALPKWDPALAALAAAIALECWGMVPGQLSCQL